MKVDGYPAPAAALPPGNDRVPIVKEAGWAPGPVWMGEKNLSHNGIRSSDRPARNRSLYRLSRLSYKDGKKNSKKYVEL
jgi:hypothetical protein